jgi:hydrogenase maturation factor
MNLAYGEIVDVEIEDGVQLGKLRVLGAIKKVPRDLVEDVKKGDRVLLCDGVAIAKARRRRQPSIS